MADDDRSQVLAAPSLTDVVAAAGVDNMAADGDVESSRSSAGLSKPTVQLAEGLALLPGAAGHDPSAASAIVDPASASPASVPPTPTADEPRPAVPAVSIAAASVDHATLELSELLTTAIEPSTALCAWAVPSVAVDPTTTDDVPPPAAEAPVELARPVPTLSAACSARLDDGAKVDPEPVAVAVVWSVASQLAVDAPSALVDVVDGAADAHSAAVRTSSAGSTLPDMVCSGAVAETSVSALTGVCVEWLGPVGSRAELEPKLAVDVEAS